MRKIMSIFFGFFLDCLEVKRGDYLGRTVSFFLSFFF